ncbi:MAG: hypothetical protein K6F30_04425 [Lachnospiraceae bacterium]|nr:hypothetical protein [Lachnospiraceae bacterium]
MPGFQELLVVGKSKYKSLVFDFDKVNNVNQYYENYQIPKEEKMMVYAYSSSFSTISLEGSGTIITDQAIYIDPSHKNWAPSNRIPLSQLCQFVVFQEESNENVHLMNKDQNCRIFGRTVAPRDTTGKELVELLRSLQKNIARMNVKERHSYEMTLGWMLDLIRKSLHDNGRLMPRDEMLLAVAEDEATYFKDIAFLRAEDLYRSCDEKKYQMFLASVKGRLDDDIYRVLERPDELFYQSFVNDISRASDFYMTQGLIEPYLNLKRLDRFTLHQCVILSYLSIRIEDGEYADKIMDMAGSYLQAEDYWKYENFRAKYHKEKLSLVYEKIEKNTEVSGPELLWQDDLGLTPLHYALILRRDDVVLRMLKQKDWSDYRSPFQKDKLINILYDPVFVASILYDDLDMIAEVFASCAKEARPINRSLKRMESFIYIQRKMMRKHPEDGMKYARVIADYEEMQQEMEEELNHMAKLRMEEARRHAAIIIETNHPFAKYLLHMYLTRDAIFYSIADTISEHRLYKYKGRYFISSLEHDLKLSYYQWRDGRIVDHRFLKEDTEISLHQKDAASYFDGDTFENPDRRAEKEREKEERRRKFEEARAAFEASLEVNNGWFSEEAKKDINILKKEYRVLVKTYHPDASGNKSATAIMQQIQIERAEILEHMRSE